MTKINFVVKEDKLVEMAYGDTVYAWLLLHSHYDADENHNYIYENEFSFTEIGKDIGRSRKTIAKRFKDLLDISKDTGRGLLYYNEKGKYYILPCFKDFQKLHAETVLNLFRMSSQNNRREELIKTYAWLKKQKDLGKKQLSYDDLIRAFGHAKGNTQTYDRYKDILTTLQGAGLIKFRTDTTHSANGKGLFDKTLYVYQVNDKASQDWLDKTAAPSQLFDNED